MRIAAIGYNNHPVLGDLALDFRDETGLAAEVVVIAGENGCGKSTILRSLTRLSAAPTSVIIEVAEAEDDAKAATLRRFGGTHSYPLQIKCIQPGPTDRHGMRSQFGAVEVNGRAISPEPVLPGLVYTLFSEADTTFDDASEPPPHMPDEGIFLSETTGRSIGGNVRRRLLALAAFDRRDLQVWVETHPGEVPPPEMIGPRISRIAAAYANLFDTKSLGRIEATQPDIYFSQFGRETHINHLSSGEQHVVFRGAYILDKPMVRSGVLLLDEPEKSLHPHWQEKVLAFYRVLAGGAQIIVATHSPFIVHDQSAAKVIILRRNTGTGAVEVAPSDAEYPEAGQSRIVSAFRLNRLFRQAEESMVLLVEGDSDKRIIDHAWSILFPNSPAFFVAEPRFAGSAIRTTLARVTGASIGTKTLVGLFDFDRGYDDWNGTFPGTEIFGTASGGLFKKKGALHAWALLLPVPDFRVNWASTELGNRSQLSIEFMFKDEQLLPGMTRQVRGPGETVFTEVVDAQKGAFATYVESLTDADAFEAFRSLFSTLRGLLQSGAT
jgi:predicted ATPase